MMEPRIFYIHLRILMHSTLHTTYSPCSQLAVVQPPCVLDVRMVAGSLVTRPDDASYPDIQYVAVLEHGQEQ